MRFAGRPLIAAVVALLALVAAWLILRGDVGSATDAAAGLSTNPGHAPIEQPVSPTIGPIVRDPSATDPRAQADPGPTSTTADATRCRIRGRVVREDGSPQSRAMVWARADGSADEQRSASAAGGTFELSVPAGRRYVVSARFTATRTASVAIDVAAEALELELQDLVLRDGAIIRGRILRDDGAPLANVRVQAQSEQTPGVTTMVAGSRIHWGGDEVFSDEDGTFRLRGLQAEDTYTVLVNTWPRTELTPDPAQYEGVVADGPPLTFTLRPVCAIEGRVIDAVTGLPVRDFSLDGLPEHGADGHFRRALGGPSPVTFEAFGYQRLTRDDLAPAPGEIRSGVRVELQPLAGAGSALLRVLDDAGRPVPEFSVTTGPRGDGGMLLHIGRDDPRRIGVDRVRIAPLPQGDHSFTVAAHGFAPTRELAVFLSEPAGAVELQVTLVRGAPVRIAVDDVDGGCCLDLPIAVADANGAGAAYRFEYNARGSVVVTEEQVARASRPAQVILREARGTLLDLPAGRYELWLYFEREPRRIPFQVLQSGETTLRIAR